MSARSAIQDRMLRFLYQRGEAPRDEVVGAGSVIGDRKRAAAILRDLQETEDVLAGSAEGTVRLSDDVRFIYGRGPF
jgi:hypothetical protein